MNDDIHKILEYLNTVIFLNKDVENFSGINIIIDNSHSVLQKGGNGWRSH